MRTTSDSHPAGGTVQCRTASNSLALSCKVKINSSYDSVIPLLDAASRNPFYTSFSGATNKSVVVTARTETDRNISYLQTTQVNGGIVLHWKATQLWEGDRHAPRIDRVSELQY